MVFVCGCACLVALGVASSISKKQHQSATQTVQALTPDPVGLGTTPEVPTPTQGYTIPQDARDAMNLLQQGLGDLDQGNQDAANQAFNDALQSIPAGRAGVIALIAQKLGARSEWLVAGEFCQKGWQANANEALLRNECEEVLFHVGESQDGKDLLSGMANQFPQWSIAQAAYGRWLAAFSGNSADADPYLQNAMNLARNEEKPIVKTIQAEYSCITHQTAIGLTSLNEVLKDPITPPWLRVEAEKIIAKWQPK
jgi:Tfp pilus assembly protein PilF